VVNATSGLPVLDPSRRQITLNPGGGRITIDRDGTIRQGTGAESAPVGRLALVDVSPADRMKLKKEGAGLYSAPAQVMNARREATGDLVQGSVERSNADPIQSMMQLTDASMAVATATRIAQIHDELMGRAIGTLGRVS
jgi:flagellar basal body rod protein FlgG